MTKSKRNILLFLVFLLVVVASIVVPNLFGSIYDPIAIMGEMELNDASYEKPVYLNGEWEFYWNHLLEPEEIGTTTLSPLYRRVPDRWDRSLVEKNTPDFYGTGYGTYHLVIHVGQETPDLGLYLQSMCTAYRLYVNGKLCATNGTVGTDKDSSVPYLKPTVIPIKAANQQVNIVLQISNFHYSSGGIWAPIRIGKFNSMLRMHELHMLYTAMVAAALSVIGILSFLLPFLSSSKGKTFIALPISSVLSAIIISTTGSMVFFTLFYFIPFRLGIMCLYQALIWLPLTSYISIKRLFHSRFTPFTHSLMFSTFILSLPVFFAPLEIFTHYSIVYNIMGLPSMIGVAYEVIRELKKDQWESYYIFFSLLIIAPSVVLSTLYHSCMLNALHFDALPIGFLTFIIIQTVIIISRYERMHRDTREALALAKEREIARLNAQIRPHFLYNALNSIILQCYKNPQQAASLLENLSIFLRNRFRFSETRQMISIVEELDAIQAYLAIESARFHKDIRMTVINTVPKCVMIPALVLQPLVENALLHGIKDKEDGEIKILTEEIGSVYRIIVQDNGKGMPEDKIKAVLSGEEIGALYNINKRLILLYDKPLIILSSHLGTRFIIEIPIE